MATGTTCATVLTQAIYAEGCKSIASGINVMDLRSGINMAVEAVISNLKSRATMISTQEEIVQVKFSKVIEVEEQAKDVNVEFGAILMFAAKLDRQGL